MTPLATTSPPLPCPQLFAPIANSLTMAPKVHRNLTSPELVQWALKLEKDSKLSARGALCVLSYAKTGRSPGDKRVVDTEDVRANVDWGKVKKQATDFLNSREHLFVVDCFAGHDERYRIKVRVITTRPYHALFMQDMLIRPTADELANFGEPDYTIYNAGECKADPTIPGVTSTTSVSLNFKTREVILGTEYAGEMKKGILTVMFELMPRQNHLCMHASANVGKSGDVSVFFGLSGTGKTTLSADPQRALIGDDEHVWTDKGVFNIEGGCYAKAIGLNPKTEKEIYDAVRFGAVAENCMLDKRTGEIDFNDESICKNTRVAYPLNHIPGALEKAVAGHPKNIIFLTNDAFGVMPPQAMFWFIMGYTANVPGVEAGSAPQLAEKMREHKANVWLLNTGYAGGRADRGAKRMPLKVTRAVIDAIHDGTLANEQYRAGSVPPHLLDPRKAWKDVKQFNETRPMFQASFRRFQGVAQLDAHACRVTRGRPSTGAAREERWVALSAPNHTILLFCFVFLFLFLALRCSLWSGSAAPGRRRKASAGPLSFTYTNLGSEHHNAPIGVGNTAHLLQAEVRIVTPFFDSFPELVQWALAGEGLKLSARGALCVLSYAKTGRSPGDKRVVDTEDVRANVDWGKVNIKLSEESFAKVKKQATDFLNSREHLFVVDCFAGHDERYRIKVRDMIRPTADELANFGEPDYTIYNAGECKADPTIPGVTSTTSVSLNFKTREEVIPDGVRRRDEEGYPDRDVRADAPPEPPVHARFRQRGQVRRRVRVLWPERYRQDHPVRRPQRALIGDDEHVWTDKGVFNIEGGCYAKAIGLNPKTEKEIYDAVRFGAVAENCMLDKRTGEIDFNDESICKNTRVAYPEPHPRRLEKAVAGHPKNIIFLTNDAFGVMPPVAKLTPEQAMFCAPVAKPLFSSCFGGPFLVRHATVYGEQLAEKMREHKANVWLLNTGYAGGRADRCEAHAPEGDPRCHRRHPRRHLANEQYRAWKDVKQFNETTRQLVGMFQASFQERFASKASDALKSAVPKYVEVSHLPSTGAALVRSGWVALSALTIRFFCFVFVFLFPIPGLLRCSLW
eukprot:gene10371-7255_t